jgi:hypothetical protein
LNESDVSLKELLDPDVFYAPENREITYALAASFTEFLIRRYGWERYGDASQSARRMGADYALWKHVGFPLADLERMWREELRAAANQSVP